MVVVVAAVAAAVVVVAVVVTMVSENRGAGIITPVRTRDPQVNVTLHYLPPIPLERAGCRRGSDHTEGPHSTG